LDETKREEMEDDGSIDRYEKMQDKTRWIVDKTMIDVWIDQLWGSISRRIDQL